MMESQNLVIDVTTEQKIQCEEDEYTKLSIDALKNKVENIKKLFHDNKIKSENSFDIPIINLVLRIVKTPTVDASNCLAMSSAFDAISKVYCCRFDDYLSTVSKFMQEFLKMSKHEDQVHITNNIIKIRPQNRVMLTTSEKLNDKENKLISQTECYVHFKNDIIDYARPSRILLNRFSNDSYWPEYKFNTQINTNCPPEKFKMKNLTSIIKKGRICPAFHEFVAERNQICNDFDLDQFDFIGTRFNQDTSELNELIVEPMDIDRQNSSDKNIDNGVSSFDERSNNLSNVLSQILPLVNEDHGDYSFFDSRITNLQCNNNWTDKFKCPGTIGKKRPKSSMLFVDNGHQQSSSSISTCQQKKSGEVECEVDFFSDINEKLDAIENEQNKNMCNYQLWAPYTNISFQVASPVRRLKMCEFINIIPKWYEANSTTLNSAIENSMSLHPQQNTQDDNIFAECIDDELITETVENIINDTVDVDYGSNNQLVENETDMNGANNFNMLSSDDDINEESEYLDGDSVKLDMHQLKKYIFNVINPSGTSTLNITFKDIVLEMSSLLLSNQKKTNISVSDIYVALLHLSNEHNLRLINIHSGDILISKNTN